MPKSSSLETVFLAYETSHIGKPLGGEVLVAVEVCSNNGSSHIILD
ncbi:uncharacterized protein METZ01_LOCUS128782 [marine metagenome]|uniref:Uncharacterized protein n=1 Tax=marine metagenome TaxID=408172 RepID=A0A381YFR4_9ZZZZ